LKAQEKEIGWVASLMKDGDLSSKVRNTPSVVLVVMLFQLKLSAEALFAKEA
jgi:hypothetical protein